MKASNLTSFQAYECGNCGKTFPTKRPKWVTTPKGGGITAKAYEAHQKLQAEACCTCPICKNKCDRYVSMNDKCCRACKSEAEFRGAAQALVNALDVYIRVSQRQNRVDFAIEDHLASYVTSRKK